MRLYSFVNGNYLSGGQHGIQTGHAAVRLARSNNIIAQKWADNHETFIILNAHNYAGLVEITDKMSQLIDMYNVLLTPVNNEKTIPYTSFYEDEDSLGGLQTCFACVLPDEFYKDLPELRRDLCADTVEQFWDGIKNNHCMRHTVEKYRNLITCTLKGYNLVQL